MALMSYEKALEATFNRLMEMGEDEFSRALDAHKGGYFAKILEETGSIDAWVTENDAFNNDAKEIILGRVSPLTWDKDDIVFSSGQYLQMGKTDRQYDLNLYLPLWSLAATECESSKDEELLCAA
jgi:hypothetical protein